MNVASANYHWLRIIQSLLDSGNQVVTRGNAVLEKIPSCVAIDMEVPIVSVSGRVTANYREFMATEAAWILSGDPRLSPLINAAPSMARYSDDGIFLHGAYGPKLAQQLNYVVETLIEDSRSRQAVVNLWRDNPRKTRDCPCTLSLQFLIRNERLNCIATMRSSDIWLGWPFDVFTFTMISGAITVLLRPYVSLGLGTLHLNVGSQHLYTKNLEQAKACIDSAYTNHLVLFDRIQFYDELIQGLRESGQGQKPRTGVCNAFFYGTE